MQVKCEYCEAFMSDTDEFCPHCGATNPHVIRTANGLPKTIEELKAYALANNLPLQQMRFFIGENYTQPKAFGIYEENGVFTVYKNKADGTRAVRYHGTDEAYAVNELYQKMHSEIMLRKQKKAGSKNMTPDPKKQKKINLIAILCITIPMVLLFLLGLIFGACKAHKPHRGYYDFGGTPYYYQGDWYGYDYDSNDWYRTTPDSEYTQSPNDYYEGSSYDYGSPYSSFESSDYYDSDWGSSNDNDSWDGGDWDSGDTDWDSDW